MNASRPRALRALLPLIALLLALPCSRLHAAPTRADTLYNQATANLQEQMTELRSLNLRYGHIGAIKSRIEALTTEATDALAAAAADYRDAGETLKAEEDAIYAAGLEASAEFDRKYQAAMQEKPVDYEAIAAAQHELDTRRAELDARTQTARLAYEAAVEAIAEILDGVASRLSGSLPALEADALRAEEIRQALAEYENEWAAASEAQRNSAAGEALSAAAAAARQGIGTWTEGTDYDALARALAEALKAFLDYLTALPAAPVAGEARQPVYDLGGRLVLPAATPGEARHRLPAGIYLSAGRKFVVD